MSATGEGGPDLLIIEAMKTMNPIPARRRQRSRDVRRGRQPVEFGQPLVVIE
jgi:acetyl-CoA carboxylase biotin carboxyl carrier protein